jgi:ubiquinone/menaquinone biosynthesis C-methylase UbiE
LSAADNRNLPIAANAVDLAIAGWSFGHATVWYEDMWKKEISLSIMELLRIVRPGGTAMVFETLGSGSDEPGPPTKTLADYYTYLEQDLGFEKIIIETDYRFSSLEEAEELSRFFFGDELGDKVVERNWVILPEWTGMWWYIKSS